MKNNSKMKNRFVISYKNLPSKIPINSIVLYTFIMYYFHAPGWVFGIWGTFCLIVILGCIAIKNKEKQMFLTKEFFNHFPNTIKAEDNED